MSILNGPIQTWDFATGGAPVASFVPTGALRDDAVGTGVAVLGNKVFYTEIQGGEGPTHFIEVAPFNGGAGGADIATLPNPARSQGIGALAVANGVLYALTGFPDSRPPRLVWGLNPVTGAVESGPVSIAGTANIQFTVLPNGNFLIGGGCTFNQFDPATGTVIPGTTITITVCGPVDSIDGVDTNGVHLFFKTNGSLIETDLTGFVIATKSVTGNGVADISLVTFGASGVPGKPSCHGKTVSDLAHQYGGMDNAASALGYSSVAALQSAVNRFCASP